MNTKRLHGSITLKLLNLIDHTVLEVSSSGLVMHPSYPHMGNLCVDKSFLEASGEQQLFLEFIDGIFHIEKDYAYYFQIQMQMKLSESLW